LLPSNTSPEETAMMVQILNTDLALEAVVHIHFLPHANLTGPDIALLIYCHVILADDSRVHCYCQEIRNIKQNQKQKVELDEDQLSFCLVAGDIDKRYGYG